MPEHAYLVNTARGEIVDEQALAHALETGAIAGAGLDVYADEPSIPEGLRARDNVVLLPHIGSATIEGRHAMGDKVIINIQTFLDGHTRQTGFWKISDYQALAANRAGGIAGYLYLGKTVASPSYNSFPTRGGQSWRLSLSLLRFAIHL